MALILNLDWELYAKGKRCPSFGDYKGRQNTVDSCGSACKGVASMFIFGTNDLEGVGCYSGFGCDCYCATGATDQGTCTTVENNWTHLYRFLNSGNFVANYFQSYFDTQ